MIVEENPSVAFHGVGEAVQVVTQEEAVDEGLAVPGVDRPIPGSGHAEKDDRPPDGVEDGFQVPEELAPEKGQ